jgi:hypothetical protein
MCMKTVKSNLSFLTLGIVLLALFGMVSCSKSSSGGGGGSTTPPVTLLGGFASSDSVEPAALIAYWPFDGSSTEKVAGLVGTATGVTYVTGIRGQAYQGSVGGSLQVPLAAGDVAFDSLHSFTVSVWYNDPSQVISPNHGLFHMYGATDWNLLELEFEPDSTGPADSVRIHAGFTNPGGPTYKGIVPQGLLDTAVAKWVHIVYSYDGPSSTYSLYQDANLVAVQSAWTNGGYSTSPVPIWTDGTATTPMGNLSFATEIPTGITIGAFPPSITAGNAWAGSFPGMLDELRVFNIALTQKDVTGLYLNGQAGR